MNILDPFVKLMLQDNENDSEATRNWKAHARKCVECHRRGPSNPCEVGAKLIKLKTQGL